METRDKYSEEDSKNLKSFLKPGKRLTNTKMSSPTATIIKA
jgi:hypothetical protein